jgi:DNA-binding CsgD family transcriptional regulator
MRAGTKKATSDVLSIVEAAYCLEEPQKQWAQRLLEVADRSVGRGLAGFACAFDASRMDGTVAIDRASAAIINQPVELVHAIFDGLTLAAPGWLSPYFAGEGGAPRCLLTSEVDPRRKLNYRDRLARSGVHDGINLVCVDLDRRGLLLSLAIPAGTTIAPERRTDLVRAATHIQSALRLRARLAAESPGAPTGDRALESVDAVLTAEGKVLHAEGDAALATARRALQTAVRDITHARTALRGDSHRALRMWKGLVSAHWTLIDRFESDGERYVVARENVPQLKGLAALTPTERFVVAYAARGFTTKEIAYTLGISAITVRVLLMRAARRYGVRSRKALLALGRRALSEKEPIK